MALSSVWDTVSDAQLEQSLASGGRLVRTGIVKGLTTAIAPSKKALFAVVNTAPGISALGDPFDVDIPSYICVYTVARGVPNTKGTMARVWQHFETPGGGGTPLERFAAEDSITLSSEPTSVFPGTGKQLRCSLTGTSPSYAPTNGRPSADTDRPITANYPRTLRSLVLYGLFADRPPLAVADAVNTVNSATWQGLGAGRWRCEGARVRYSSRDGMYAVTCGFLTKGSGAGQDWTTYEVPRLSTGEPAAVKSSDLATLYAAPYQNAVRSDKNAIFAAGLYETRNFTSIFGNDFPIGD